MRVSVLVCALIVTGISAAATAVECSMTYGGIDRSYVVLTPDAAPGPDGYPLIIGLHGTGASGAQFILTAALVPLADARGVMAVCPDALMFENYTYFNAGGPFEDLTGGTDDIGFVSAMLDTVLAGYDVDPSRVYVMGFSNGSAMAYRVAAQMSDRIAALGAVSGQMVYEYCNPAEHVPLIHFHGLSDRFIPFEGNGAGIPSVQSVIDIWRGINGCTGSAETICDRNGILGLRWESAGGDGEVELYTIQDQEHEWPRLSSLQISATNVIWEFMEGCRRN
jgi:polyhydroxybutyrate depolymerase